jgi:hypothetical protein
MAGGTRSNYFWGHVLDCATEWVCTMLLDMKTKLQHVRKTESDCCYIITELLTLLVEGKGPLKTTQDNSTHLPLLQHISKIPTHQSPNGHIPVCTHTQILYSFLSKCFNHHSLLHSKVLTAPGYFYKPYYSSLLDIKLLTYFLCLGSNFS